MIEIEKDHRNVGQRLELFHFQEEAPGMVFWHPQGLVMYQALEAAVRAQSQRQGYREVRTPQVLRRATWDASGHWTHFGHAMFRVQDDAQEAALKPVSCPGHLYIVARRPLSYRELPVRLCEFGSVHRDEPSGTLHGLLRLRQFTQDDGHIFCTEEQAEDEVLRFCQAVPAFYAAFGFHEVRMALSTRPTGRLGSEAQWDHAEAALRSVARQLELECTEQPGEGAFYGPKLEFSLRDAHGRDWQCGTIQFDLAMPERFDLQYVAAGGERRRPIMLHRALYGSLERFLGVVLEHYGARLPPWLSPVQAVVLPISEAQHSAAQDVVDRMKRAGLRVNLEGEGSLARRLAEAHARAIEHVLVIGAREALNGTATLRVANQQEVLSVGETVERLVARCRAPSF